jgi:uncharacterized protein VirK/YbjX
MNVIIDIFNRFITAVCNTSDELLQKEEPYMFAMVISYIDLRFTTKDKCDTVNSEYTVPNSKYDHSTYPHLLGYINCFYEYKTHTKASLNANAHEKPASD